MALRKITNIYTKIQKHKFKTTKITRSISQLFASDTAVSFFNARLWLGVHGELLSSWAQNVASRKLETSIVRCKSIPTF